MNSIKPLITIAVLGGIGYVVYNQLNSKPPTPPPGAPQGWESGATVQMPGEGATDSKWGGLGGSANSLLPPAAIGGGSAPTGSDSTAPTFGGAQTGSVAPTFGGAANYGDTTPAAAAPAAGPVEEKWGTTDPAAAVPSETPAATASYGDAPAYGSAGNTAAGTGAPIGGAPEIGGTSPAEAAKQYAAAWENGNRLLEEGKLAEGLRELSQWYDHPQLSAVEHQQLTELLDQLAGTVIYSVQHHLEPAYVVKEGERLDDIAAQYNVPPQLLAKINGIDDPASLQPGEQLKVVRGPFSASLSLGQRQLTMMLNGMYAGRFLIGIGRDMPPREGSFAVTEKVVDPVYHGRERTIEAKAPDNPLGTRWIALGTDMGIHGIGPLTDITSTNQPGSISLGPRDIEDVFDILSVGSKVIIVK